MPTIEQIRAARALLGWSQKDLAENAGLSTTGIARIENSTHKPNSATLTKLEKAFDQADIEFLGLTGLHKRSNALRHLHGSEGFSLFLDDVYDTIIKYGSKEDPVEVFLSNVVHENWLKWMGPEQWKKHTDRMIENKDVMDIRIIVKENDWHFPANAYSQYKWFPEELFNDKSFYSYHDKLAFLDFHDDGVHITIMQNKEFSEGYRVLFRIAWDHLAITPQQQKGER